MSAGSIPAMGNSGGGIGRRAALRTQFLWSRGSSPFQSSFFMTKINIKVKIIWPKNYLFNSFWGPKVINQFITKGNKEPIEKEFFIFFKTLKKITINPIFLILGLIKRVRPVFGLKKILNKVSKMQTEAEEKIVKPKYIRIPMVMRKLRGMKIGIKWFKQSCLLFWSKIPLNQRLYNETVSLFIHKSSKILLRKKTFYAEGLKNRLSVKYRWIAE